MRQIDGDEGVEALMAQAGAGVPEGELDREHVYPPDKWGKPAGPPQGPPYEVKPVEPWPAEVNRRLAHLETLVHKLMNPEEKRDLQSDFELY